MRLNLIVRLRGRRFVIVIFGLLFTVFLLSYIGFWFTPPVNGRETALFLKQEALAAGEKYVKYLASEQTQLLDGPYSGRETYYDLKKTLAILLENMYERIGKLEAGMFMLRNESGSNLVALRASDLLMGAQEKCDLPTSWNITHKMCMEKIKWMEIFWQSDPCYVRHGVDGSRCSFIIYLSETEKFCPRLSWRPQLTSTALPSHEEAIPQTDLQGLLELMKDNPTNYQWIKTRIERLWPQWVRALKNLTQRQGYTFKKRQKKKILLHMGFLTKESGFKFGEKSLKGGPLGELVQWSDLMASLYILGHNIIISSELNTFKSYAQADETLKSSCPVTTSDKLDIIFTDIVGVKQIKKKIPASLQNYKCRLRVLDSFGTQAEFNDPVYFSKHKQQLGGNNKNPWGGHALNLQQFYNMYPHTPDNSFLGFIVENFSNSTDVNASAQDFATQDSKTSRKNWALVYGKEDYMWKGFESYIRTISEVMQVHATVADADSNVPDYVVNHGVLSGPDLHKLLRKVKVFVGLGFPYEGPAPLEAIANGAIFLNPKFETPKGRSSDKFFAEKPTLRVLTSQNPYTEDFIGEPHVITIDITNLTAVRQAVEKARTTEIDPHLPVEFTHEGMLERLNALINYQDFCDTYKRNWPPFSAMRLIMSDPIGEESCKEACWKQGLVCEPSYFPKINSVESLSQYVVCSSNVVREDVSSPYFNTASGECCLQPLNSLLFSCASKAIKGASRLCPCRDFIKDQVSLCAACL